MWTRAFAIVVAVLAVAAGVVMAQQSAPPGTRPGASEEVPAKAPPAASEKVTGADTPEVPDPKRLMMLIRSTLLAVNQANMTGNYTVLRELGTPGFQYTNSAANLADVFRDLRKGKTDISPIAVLKVKAVRKPGFDANGRLRLTGYFPSRPERVNFDLAFERIGGQWRLHGIALNTTPNETPVAATEATAQPATTQPKSDSKPEAIKKPTAAAAERAVTPVRTAPADKKAQSDRKASAATSKPVSAAEVLPDVRDTVDQLEAKPPPETKPKPKQSYNPFGSF